MQTFSLYIHTHTEAPRQEIVAIWIFSKRRICKKFLSVEIAENP